jgi:hypothetical protein
MSNEEAVQWRNVKSWPKTARKRNGYDRPRLKTRNVEEMKNGPVSKKRWNAENNEENRINIYSIMSM